MGRSIVQVRRAINANSVEKGEAIVVRRHRLTETSLLVGWCSPGHGLVRTVARGALRPRSPFAGRIDLFHRCEIAFTRARRGDLHHLREVEVLATHHGVAASYRRTLAATYFVRLLETVAELETPMPEFYDLLNKGLGYLDTTEPTREAVRRYESRVAELLGLGTGPGAGGGAEAIARLLHRLPKQRDELLGML